MTKEKLDLQRNVVRNERRQSYENRPYGVAELVIADALYPRGPPVPPPGHRQPRGPRGGDRSTT